MFFKMIFWSFIFWGGEIWNKKNVTFFWGWYLTLFLANYFNVKNASNTRIWDIHKIHSVPSEPSGEWFLSTKSVFMPLLLTFQFGCLTWFPLQSVNSPFFLGSYFEQPKLEGAKGHISPKVQWEWWCNHVPEASISCSWVDNKNTREWTSPVP